jgi:hypothetical protein
MFLLKAVFRTPFLKLHHKREIYKTHVLSIVLYGCESWALSFDNRRKLRSFHHKSIRSIMNINMHQVQHQHIKNEKIRQDFGIHDITDYVNKRQMKWIYHLGGLYIKQQEENKNWGEFTVQNLLFAWCEKPKNGRPQRSLRDTYRENLLILYPNEPAFQSGKGSDFKLWREDIRTGQFLKKITLYWRDTAPKKPTSTKKIAETAIKAPICEAIVPENATKSTKIARKRATPKEKSVATVFTTRSRAERAEARNKLRDNSE